MAVYTLTGGVSFGEGGTMSLTIIAILRVAFAAALPALARPAPAAR